MSVTVTVTKALVLRCLLEDRGRITESIRILVSVDRMEQKCFQITTKRVRRSQQFQLRWQPTKGFKHVWLQTAKLHFLVRVVKPRYCYPRFCLSVRPSVHLPTIFVSMRSNRSRYREVLYTIRYGDVSSFLRPNVVVMSLGFTPNECVKTDTYPPLV